MQNLRDWLEILSFISNAAIAVIAFFALGQITVAKKQVEAQRRALLIDSKRNALQLTAEQIAEYGSKIVPLIDAFDQKVKAEQVTFFTKFKVDVSKDSIKVSALSADVDIDDAMKVGREFVAVANALEAFASYFASGVADEGMAYLSLSTTFCGTVEELAPLLVRLGADDRRFAAILHLFTIWSCRLEAEALNKQKEEIEEKLKNKKSVTIKTVGTDG